MGGRSLRSYRLTLAAARSAAAPRGSLAWAPDAPVNVCENVIQIMLTTDGEESRTLTRTVAAVKPPVLALSVEHRCYSTAVMRERRRQDF